MVLLGGKCSDDDQALADINNGKNMMDWFEGCISVTCLGQCAANCMKKHGFSEQCLPCFKKGANCIKDKCAYHCSGADPLEIFGTCKGCIQEKCMPGFITCSGLSLPLSDKLVHKLINGFN